LSCASPGIAQAPVSGIGQAKDGDSLMVGGTEVRLFGFDAPEFDQHCQRGGQEELRLGRRRQAGAGRPRSKACCTANRHS
jgi:hypothetical protein